MKQLTYWNWIVSVLAYILLPLPFAGATPDSQERPPSALQGQGDFLEYRLRTGESLGEVARLFRIPLEELVQVNHIVDPTRLAVGQSVKVPNIFARQVSQLQGERNRLLQEKQQEARTIQELQQTVAVLEGQFHTVAAEKSALADQLASTLPWRTGTLSLAVLLLGVAGWCLKLKGDQASLSCKMTSLLDENMALNLIKDKYRQTAAQLELRYQKLYRSHEGVSAKFLAEGTALLAQAFDTGCAQLEQLLARIQAEKETQLLQEQEQKVSGLFHSLRGFLHRTGLHTIQGGIERGQHEPTTLLPSS